ncbi:MAG: CDP-diacylglycerol--glycerol-3-phosphate 3-phosphatidyltransferase [Gemmataceae bacterium]|nr:CDP-diacylglycerol--glycerol-3-phosphate 3-phosphatidyltransferase [Gemmataceae bacterium]
MNETAALPEALQKQPSPFNLPNQLTAARLVLGIVLFVLIEMAQWRWCTIVFAVAAFTDWLDGYLARKMNLGSTLGRNLDPLVDKVVICGAYIFLTAVPDSGLTPWIATVVVSRELIITGLRTFMENIGANFGADMLGKIKMTLQCAALFAVFVVFDLRNADQTLDPTLKQTRDILIWAMLAATAFSGLQYLWRAFALLRK